MDLRYLVDNEYLIISEYDVTQKFKSNASKSDQHEFLGQYDPTAQPNGIVREIEGLAHMYEGQMTSDGNYNGFGVLY